MNRVLYIAEPIDQSNFGPWKESVQSMTAVAAKAGWLCYRPARAWTVDPGTRIGPELETLNRFVMGVSGAVLAHLPSGVPSVGVPREVEWAVNSRVPVAVVTDRATWSLADVDVIEPGDTVTFAQWLKAASDVGSGGYPLTFTLDPGGTLPTRANDGDAGFDLYVSEEREIGPGEFVDVPCGARVAMPPGVWGRITGRSSTLRRRELLVAEGVIDTGYRGPLYAGVWNLGDKPHTVLGGERIAQLVLHENVASRHRAVRVDRGFFDRVPGDGRGESGFGSSGS